MRRNNRIEKGEKMKKFIYYAEHKPSMLEDYVKNSYENQSWKDWYRKNRHRYVGQNKSAKTIDISKWLD